MSKYHTLRPSFLTPPVQRWPILQGEMRALLDGIQQLVTHLQYAPLTASLSALGDTSDEVLTRLIQPTLSRVQELLDIYAVETQQNLPLTEDTLQCFRHDLIAPVQSIQAAADLLMQIAYKSNDASIYERGRFEQLVQASRDLIEALEALANPGTPHATITWLTTD